MSNIPTIIQNEVSCVVEWKHFINLKLLKSIDFRYYLHETYPSILAGFYKSSEILSGEEALKKIRESDSAIFAAQNQSKNV